MAAVAFLGQVWLALDRPDGDRLADLQVYAGATQAMQDGGTLYDYVRSNGDRFTYPPAAGYLLAWAGALPWQVTESIWAVLTAGAFVLLAVALTRALPAARGRPRTATTAIIALVLVGTAPGRSDVAFGQVSVLVAALAAADLFRPEPSRRRGRWNGVLLGIAAAVKLTPLPFIALLWLAGRRRQATVALATALGLTVAAALAAPDQSRRYWTRELFDSGRFVNAWIPGNQSLRAAIERAHLPHAAAWWLAGAAALTCLALVVGARLAGAGAWPAAVGVVGAATVVASPISWTHHQIWLLVLPYWLLAQPATARITGLPGVANGWVRGWMRGWAVVALAAMTVGVVTTTGPLDWTLTNLRLLVALSCIAVGAALLREHRLSRLGRSGRPGH